MLAGIPQSGIHLGSPNAPVRLVEFADLQCPFCREYTLQTLPALVQDYVRTGKVRMEFRDLAFIGGLREGGPRSAAAAGAQNKLWNFVDIFYYNQGEENTGYVTRASCDSIDKAAGVDSAKAEAFAATAASAGADRAGQRARRAARRAVDADRLRGQARRRAAAGRGRAHRRRRPSSGHRRGAGAGVSTDRRLRLVAIVAGRGRPRASRPT